MFAFKRLNHCPAVLSLPPLKTKPLKRARRIELLPLFNPPPPSLSGSPATRATWGDVCSLARRMFYRKSVCLYETCNFASGLFSTSALGIFYHRSFDGMNMQDVLGAGNNFLESYGTTWGFTDTHGSITAIHSG
ncbi:hypothetical protein [Marivivens niveibacter]|uniref:hypothetical protein n=1 Tax=Marivivens niveibacter TaxID=1930667 RepID=UPI0010550EB5|nr:hypothetical protein [Marivivens niveibacter]